MDVFVARQPIFNDKREVFAYELLFRSGTSNSFPDIDGETATSSLLSSSFLTVGIDRISSGKKVFINFTQELLVRELPSMFPKEKVIVEILENVDPTIQVVAACQSLQRNGYTLALDDFVYRENLIPLIEAAEIIKVDFRLTPEEDILKFVSYTKKFKCRLLAEKIETYQEFQNAKTMGFSYFQGYFFARPEILRNKDISSSQMSSIRLISMINDQEFDIDSLEKVINQDISITYKLLKYLNSSYFSRIQQISSIKQAITFLGEKGIRLFVSLIVISKLVDHKPAELARISAIRANFLYQIGKELQIQSAELFLLGLFSLVDAMLDNTMENLVRQLPLTKDVSTALVERTGKLFPYLKLVESYESCNWELLEKEITTINFEAKKVNEFYLDSVKLADSLLG